MKMSANTSESIKPVELKSLKPIKTKTIKETIIIAAEQRRIYDALTNPRIHSKLTGSKAKGTDKLGKFSTYDGYSFGENKILKRNRKIVQTWSCAEWSEGHFSEVTFELKPGQGATKLVFTQTNVPASQYSSIMEGWKKFYWGPLKKLLESDD